MRTTLWAVSILGFGLLSACGQGADAELGSSTAAVDATGAPSDVTPPRVVENCRLSDAGCNGEVPPPVRAEEPDPDAGRVVAETFDADPAPKLLSVLANKASELHPNNFVATKGAPGKNPDQISLGGAKLQEVDVVHVGGLSASTPPLLLTVVGTGGVGILSSFRSESTAVAPTHLSNSPRMLGYDHQLHVLTPPTQPKAKYEVVVSGRIHAGVLWLTSWRVHKDGSIEQLHSLGYGSNVDVTVEHYSMAHRVLQYSSKKRFQVVTPIVDDAGKQRLVSWEVDGTSGQITGRYHSDPLSTSAVDDSDLSVSLNEGLGAVAPHFVTTMRSPNQDRLNQTLWAVSDGGVPSVLKSTTSGKDIQNNATLNLSVENALTAPINATGHVTAAIVNDKLRLDVWEDSTCIDDNCSWGALNVSNSTRDVNPNQAGVQQGAGAQPQPATGKVYLRDPLVQNDMFSKNLDTIQAIASVRKVMVLVVTLDAVKQGGVDLDDVVTVSSAAAAVNGTGANAMGLVAGEKISLRRLLYGMMMVSAGDATWAISEYVGGDRAGMLTLMNAKATALGMTNTFHCQLGNTFSGVSYSTARDQMTLWESAYLDPDFLEFAGRGQQSVCGTVNGQAFCHPLNQPNNQQPMQNSSMSQYPNMDGYKTGGGGGKCTDLAQYASTPSCPGGGCLAVQASRLGRPLILLELQPDTTTGSQNWSDMLTMYDFGFRQIFTPERLGDSAQQAGNANTFALDVVDDLFATTATLKGGSSFELCNWAVDLEAGDVDKALCTTLNVNSLASSSRQPRPARLDMARLSTLYADGDYLVGHLNDTALQLSLWRVGQRD